jgi:histidinol phosphatase-like PHP family hydrolase
MDGMSVYTQASEAQRNKIRAEMIEQAERLLVDAYATSEHCKSTAIAIVDAALEKESNEHIESSNTQQSA